MDVFKNPVLVVPWKNFLRMKPNTVIDRIPFRGQLENIRMKPSSYNAMFEVEANIFSLIVRRISGTGDTLLGAQFETDPP